MYPAENLPFAHDKQDASRVEVPEMKPEPFVHRVTLYDSQLVVPFTSEYLPLQLTQLESRDEDPETNPCPRPHLETECATHDPASSALEYVPVEHDTHAVFVSDVPATNPLPAKQRVTEYALQADVPVVEL